MQSAVLLVLGGMMLADNAVALPKRPGYDVRFEGVPRSLRPAFKEASLAIELREHGSSTPRILDLRAQKDEARFGRVLQSRGYYAYKVSHTWTEEPNSEKQSLTYQVDPGPPYRIASALVRENGTREIVAGYAGRPATEAEIKSVGEAAVLRWKSTGYPWAQRSETIVRVNRETATVDLEIKVDPGQRARVGPVEQVGLRKVDPDYVATKIAFHEGEWYDQHKVGSTRKELAATSLFSVLRVTPAPAPDAEGRVPIRIELGERPFRTVSLSLRYQTDQGPGAAVGLEHRNVFGRGERFRTQFNVDDIEVAWENRFVISDFFRPHQELQLRFDLRREQTDAYDADSVTAGASVGRPLFGSWRGRLGVEHRFSQVIDDVKEERFLLLSVPAVLDHNTSNDTLDPDRGHRLVLRSAPFFNLERAADSFTKSSVSLRTYLPLVKEPRLLVAGRVAVGSIGGASLGSVPANERFYAGGGGSIRGYAYQSVGPLDESNDPVGGRSLLEGSMEVRASVSRTIELVLFADAGTASESTIPGDGENLLVGAGVGLRYGTPIGPIRADVGFPLDRRAGLDDAFQLYISIGQAF